MPVHMSIYVCTYVCPYSFCIQCMHFVHTSSLSLYTPGLCSDACVIPHPHSFIQLSSLRHVSAISSPYVCCCHLFLSALLVCLLYFVFSFIFALHFRSSPLPPHFTHLLYSYTTTRWLNFFLPPPLPVNHHLFMLHHFFVNNTKVQPSPSSSTCRLAPTVSCCAPINNVSNAPI